jgi:hypothetical protein
MFAVTIPECYRDFAAPHGGANVFSAATLEPLPQSQFFLRYLARRSLVYPKEAISGGWDAQLFPCLDDNVRAERPHRSL